MTETIKTLREALERLLNDAPSLSREYLRTTCDDKPDTYTICGFYKKDWLRANDARDFALAALSRLEAEQPKPFDFTGMACGTYIRTGCEQPITCNQCAMCQTHCKCEAQPTPPVECPAKKACTAEALELRRIMSGRGPADRGYVITFADAEAISLVITRLMGAALSPCPPCQRCEEKAGEIERLNRQLDLSAKTDIRALIDNAIVRQMAQRANELDAENQRLREQLKEVVEEAK